MQIRCCERGDLDALEWDGEFTHDRPIIERAFARTLEGAGLMLLAEHAGALVGQAWIDFAEHDRAAYLWALRVKPAIQRRGIGRLLLLAAEREVAARGLDAIELEVEPGNAAARRLYDRLGYAHVRSPCEAERALLRLRKSLRPGESSRSSGQQPRAMDGER